MDVNGEQMDNQVFKGLLMTYCTIIMLNSLDGLKGTVMYSKKLSETLEVYSKAKQRGIYVKSGTEDQAANGAMMLERLVYAITSISQQPEKVQERFDTELQDLMIRYGVNMIEMQGI